MRFIPTKLILPLPAFVTREYFTTVTIQELCSRKEFIEYMIRCDELITTSDDAQFYIDLFSVLMLEEKFLPPTDRHFSATAQRASQMPITVERIERALAFTMAVSGPNEALPNVFVAYEFLTCVRQFALHAAGKVARRRQSRQRIDRRCRDLHQLGILTFILAIKVQLGLELPECWQRTSTETEPKVAAEPTIETEMIVKPESADEAEPNVATPVEPEVAPLPAGAAASSAEPPALKLVGSEPDEAQSDENRRRAARKEREAWTIWNSTNLLGKANMILCWYWDGDTDDWDADKDWLRDGMKVVRRLLEGKDTSKFTSDEWFAAFDPLASYPEPDEELEALCRKVREKYEAAARSERR